MRLGGREQNGGGNRAAAKTMILGFARSATPDHRLGTPVMGIGLWGLSPLWPDLVAVVVRNTSKSSQGEVLPNIFEHCNSSRRSSYPTENHRASKLRTGENDLRNAPAGLLVANQQLLILEVTSLAMSILS